LFASRGFRLSPSNRRQAYIPAGALAAENPSRAIRLRVLKAVGPGVAAAGAGEACEHRLGGDPAAVRIRAATLLLDLLRRAVVEAKE
jgi:hypothetical protein